MYLKNLIFIPLLIISMLFSKPLNYLSENRIFETQSIAFNLIDVDISNSGHLVDYHLTGHSGMEWPANSNHYIDFQHGLWFAGFVNNELKVANNEYSSEFIPGYSDSDPFAEENRIYTVSLYDIENPDNNSNILEWPWIEGAPWIDSNYNGVYDPENGDLPDMHGDLMAWFITNDSDTSSHVLYGTGPLDINVSYLTWGYFGSYNNNSLQSTLFTKTIITNNSQDIIENFKVGIWDDPDLGDAGDDFVGCNLDLNLGYAYNDGADNEYGDNPPAIGRVILNNEENNMASFVKYINGDAIYKDPETSQEVYNYLSGLLPDGSPFINSETGEETPFVASCNPNNNTGVGDGCWVDGDDHFSADRRFVMSINPFDLLPSASKELIFATVISRGENSLESVSQLFEDTQNIIDFHDNGLIVDGDSSMVNIEVISSIILDDNLNHDGQWNNGEAIKLELSLSNLSLGETELMEYLISINPTSPNVNMLENAMQIASFQGNDLITLEPIIIQIPFEYNYSLVNFSITFMNESQNLIMTTLNISIPVAEFQGSPDMIQLEQTIGNADNEVGIYIINLQEITGDDYLLTFTEYDSIFELILDDFEFGLRENRDTLTVNRLNLFNQSSGEYLLQNHPMPDKYGFNIPVTEGFKLDLGLISNGIHGIYMVHDGVNSTESNSDAAGLSVLQEHVWINYDGVLAWATNSSGGYYFATQGGGTPASEESYYERVFRGTNFDRAIPNDFEMRFTESGGQAWLAYTSGNVIDVPFELWNVGDLSDPSDDYRMLPFVYDVDGTESYNWSGDLEDSGADNDPGTDWVYWWNPVDKSAGTTGYDAFFGGTGDYEAEVMARTVWNNWNGYGSTVDSLALSELSDPDPANWTASDTTMFSDRGWFLDDVNSLAGVTVSGDHAFGTIILFPADGSVYRWVTNKPIKTGDEFQFSTSSLSIKKNDIALNNYYLISAFPNPFNPITTIKFNIPIMTLKEVTIEIFNLNGKLIETIIDNQKLSGEIRINWNGNLSPSGIYFIKLKIDNSISTHKIILLK